MTILIAGLALFTAIHLLPSAPALRAVLIGKLTPGGYKGLFSLLSLVSIVVMVVGLKRAEFVHWYAPPEWGRQALMLLMLPALYLFLSNSVLPVPSSARALTANPANWSVVLWSGGHLLANGDRAHVVLFSTFLLFAVFSMATGRARGLKPTLARRPPVAREAVFLVIVLLVYGALTWNHVHFAGVAVT